jgi:hypothetical protein
METMETKRDDGGSSEEVMSGKKRDLYQWAAQRSLD